MGRREVCSECIETLECDFRWRIAFIIVIVVFGLCSNWQETFNDSMRKSERLDSRLLEFDEPD